MVAVLKDYQFEFGGLVFGIGAPMSVTDEGFDVGSDELVIQDTEISDSDSWAMGEDSITPSPWAWTLHSDLSRNAEDAVRDMGALSRIWKDRKWRSVAGASYPLRYALAGRTRVVFGRPGRCSPTLNNGLIYGLGGLVTEFRRSDALFYDDAVRSALVTAVASSDLGLVAPITSPVTTMAGAAREGTITEVGGDVDAPMIVTMTAGSVPLTNPRVYGQHWELGLLDTLGPGQSVTISTYPWDFRALRSDGANLSGKMTPGTRMSKARLPVSGDTLYFDGIDSSGTATCNVQWRPTYNTI